MPFYEREEKIISILRINDITTVDEIAEKLFVSKPTVRRDLEKLVKRLSIEKDDLEKIALSFKKMTDINTFLDELFEAYDIVFQPYGLRTDISKDEAKILIAEGLSRSR